MANAYENYQVVARASSDVERRFMASVYRWMTMGLLVTSGVAWYVASTPVALKAILGNQFVFWGLIIAQFGLVITLSAAVNKLSAGAAGALFILYSAVTGATMSVVLLAYTGASVASAFAVTAGTFLAMSVYGTVTKRDLAGWSTFLFMGLIGIVIASVVNIFTKSSMLAWVVSCAAVVVFTGLTAYDTQRLRRMAALGGSVAALPVNGALALYLDFINLFLSILNIFGGRRN
ncbi:MAG: Bax inhibitor-1/YccA family protein [Deltaproteobacteria bacterium]